MRTPWPISTIGATMVTMLSSPIVTHAFGLNGAAGGCRVETRAEGDRDAESAGGHQKRTARERLCVGIVQHGALPLYATL